MTLSIDLVFIHDLHAAPLTKNKNDISVCSDILAVNNTESLSNLWIKNFPLSQDSICDVTKQHVSCNHFRMDNIITDGSQNQDYFKNEISDKVSKSSDCNNEDTKNLVTHFKNDINSFYGEAARLFHEIRKSDIKTDNIDLFNIYKNLNFDEEDYSFIKDAIFVGKNKNSDVGKTAENSEIPFTNGNFENSSFDNDISRDNIAKLKTDLTNCDEEAAKCNRKQFGKDSSILSNHVDDQEQINQIDSFSDNDNMKMNFGFDTDNSKQKYPKTDNCNFDMEIKTSNSFDEEMQKGVLCSMNGNYKSVDTDVYNDGIDMKIKNSDNVSTILSEASNFYSALCNDSTDNYLNNDNVEANVNNFVCSIDYMYNKNTGANHNMCTENDGTDPSTCAEKADVNYYDHDTLECNNVIDVETDNNCINDKNAIDDEYSNLELDNTEELYNFFKTNRDSNWKNINKLLGVHREIYKLDDKNVEASFEELTLSDYDEEIDENNHLEDIEMYNVDYDVDVSSSRLSNKNKKICIDNQSQESQMLNLFTLMGYKCLLQLNEDCSDIHYVHRTIQHVSLKFQRRKIARCNRGLRLYPRCKNISPESTISGSNSLSQSLQSESNYSVTKEFLPETYQSQDENLIKNSENACIDSRCMDSDEEFFTADDGEEHLEESNKNPKKRAKISKNTRNQKRSKDTLLNMGGDASICKYWYNRYNFFSKYDEGIKLDKESWYSVTPENIARNVAERCQCDLIIDAFCGAGGNSIQFAFTCERVIAIDIDPTKIELARHNARVYGIEDRIEFIIGDFFQLASTLKADVVFLSPPWGGPNYLSKESFTLEYILDKYGGGKQLFNITKSITDDVAYYLPRNTNVNEILELGTESGVELEQNIFNKKVYAIMAYFGTLRQYGNDEGY